MSYDMHPDVKAALEQARELRHRIADMRERIDRIRARRPSPNGMVIPEVDAVGRLTDLYITPGACAHLTNEELVSEIVAAIKESTADAARQQEVIMAESVHPSMESLNPNSEANPEQSQDVSA